LIFVQRYKFELDESQRERLKALVRVQGHHQITTEVRRELGAAAAAATRGGRADDASSVGMTV
jgi:uncharacterized protein YeaO (DUF488 family)